MALLVALLLVPAGAAAEHAAGAPYRNPVFSRDFPDPFVLRAGTSYYAYGTTTAWEGLNSFFPVLRSTDLAHWSYIADALTTSPAWGVGDWWRRT
jgi:beta-xylosidase